VRLLIAFALLLLAALAPAAGQTTYPAPTIAGATWPSCPYGLAWFSSTGAATCVANGASGKVLTSSGATTAPTWSIGSASSYSRIAAFHAANDGSNPSTTLDFNAQAIDLYNPVSGGVEKTIVAPAANLQCSINIYGAGGRDQAGAFASGDTIYGYYIWGSTPGLSCIWSKTGPTAGPALPGNYTSWAYAVPLILFGGSASLTPTLPQSGVTGIAVNDREVTYTNSPVYAFSGGYPTYNISFAAYVPQAALMTLYIMDAELHASAGGPVQAGYVCSHDAGHTANYCNISLYPPASNWYAQDVPIRVDLRSTAQVTYGYVPPPTAGTPDQANIYAEVVGYTF